MKKLAQNNSGFTLIETLIYVLIIAGVITSMTAIVFNLMEGREKSKAVREVQQNGRIAVELIAQQIRAADAVVTPTAGTNGSSLELDMPDPLANITIELNGSDQIEIDGNAITSDEVIVDSLTFYNISPDNTRGTVKILLDISHVQADAEQSQAADFELETTIPLSK